MQISLTQVFNYSQKCDSNKRKAKQIKFLIIHYTGMRKETEAIER